MNNSKAWTCEQKKRLKKWNQNPQILVQLSPDDIINWRNDHDDGLSSNNNNEDEADKGPLQLAQAGVEVPISAEYEDDNKPSKLVFCYSICGPQCTMITHMVRRHEKVPNYIVEGVINQIDYETLEINLTTVLF